MSVLLGLAAPAAAEELPSDTFATALETFDAAWDAAPFGFAVATFVDTPAKGYGRYTPRDDKAFTAGDVLNVYAEPVAYGFTPAEDGVHYDMEAAFRLLTPSGQVLAEEAQFAEFSGTTRSRKRELSTQLSFTFEGLPAGIYTLSITMTDKTSDQAATFDLPFEVASPN